MPEPSDFLNANGKWTCTKCGACCMNVRPFIPEFDRGDGVCRNLTPEKTCAIYEDRPAICRYDDSISDDQKAAFCSIVAGMYGG